MFRFRDKILLITVGIHIRADLGGQSDHECMIGQVCECK